MGTAGSFCEVKRPGHEDFHLHPFPRLRMSRDVHSIPPTCFYSCSGTTLPLPLHKACVGVMSYSAECQQTECVGRLVNAVMRAPHVMFLGCFIRKEEWNFLNFVNICVHIPILLE
jgi:hypothetical protein